MPKIPPWLDALAGITEAARLVLAAILEADRVSRPVAYLRQRFGLRHDLDDTIGGALHELRARRLIRGDASCVWAVRR